MKGEDVAFEAHVVSGTPPYSYEWSIRRRRRYLDESRTKQLYLDLESCERR